jgi:hypothetical protein
MRHDITCACNGNVQTVVDKLLIVTSIHRMSNNDNHEAATVDGSDVESRLAFADKAEFLLVRILAALGYESDKLTPTSLLAGIAAWVTLLIAMKRDPSGACARVWFDTVLVAARDVDSESSVCVAFADNITNEFARRFPPFLEDDRPTYDDKDFADMRAELERQTIISEKLAIELDTIRDERDALKRAMIDAGKLYDTRMRELARAEALCVETNGRVIELTAQRDQFMRAMDKMAGALVPLAKPERVEPGQRWAKVYSIDINASHEVFANGTTQPEIARDIAMLNGDKWVYLGTDKV